MLSSSASAAAPPAALPRSLLLPTIHFDDFRKQERSTRMDSFVAGDRGCRLTEEITTVDVGETSQQATDVDIAKTTPYVSHAPLRSV